jgi:predicted membrane chloride channel (bestrophin family)
VYLEADSSVYLGVSFFVIWECTVLKLVRVAFCLIGSVLDSMLGSIVSRVLGCVLGRILVRVLQSVHVRVHGSIHGSILLGVLLSVFLSFMGCTVFLAGSVISRTGWFEYFQCALSYT